MTRLLTPAILQRLTRDGWLLFATRFIRLFAYGSLSVVLVFYLVGIGLSEPQTGMLLTLTLAGDTVVSLVPDDPGRSHRPSPHADVGALLMAAAGTRLRDHPAALAARACGHDRRDQPERQRSRTVPVDRAGGALARRDRPDQDGGLRLVHAWRDRLRRRSARWPAARLPRAAADTLRWRPVGSYRGVIVSVCGCSAWSLPRCSPVCLRAPKQRHCGEKKAFQATFAGLSGLDRSRGVVMKLSGLFALDSFGGGFVVQSFAAYWFYLRFGVESGDARGRYSSGPTSLPASRRCWRRDWRRASA